MRLGFEDVRVASAFVGQLDEDRPKISIRSWLQFTPVCYPFRNAHCVFRELDVSLVIHTIEAWGCLRGLGSWNRLSPRNLPSLEGNTLQLETCVAERAARKWPPKKRPVSGFWVLRRASRTATSRRHQPATEQKSDVSPKVQVPTEEW